MKCTSCGREVSVGAHFCSNCGAAQASAGDERRVVTALFADIVGFTGLAERRDPEQVKRLIDRAFERLAKDIVNHGGMVDKVLGDGIIALFGAPVAHEDDAERAVRAALSMQQTMDELSSELDPPLALRIGVNTGEVLVGTNPAGGDYTAMGDVMNSADRLQGLAQPGQTLVGEATRIATGDSITYRSLGRLAARGRDEPLAAWLALEAVRLPGFHREQGEVFVGRRNELAVLESQARLAFEGHRSQLAVVFGEAGMGKSRLINEASARIVGRYGARVLSGRCLPYGEANAWWAVADLVRDLFAMPFDMPQLDAEAAVAAGLADHLGSEHDSILRYTTALVHALGYHTDLRGGDRQRNRSEVMLAFSTVLEAELARRPVIVTLSDMHWAAPAVWGLVEHLLTELSRCRLVVLMSARWTGEDLLPRGRHGLTAIQLGPLDDTSAAELIGQLATDLPDLVIDELVDRGGGNPFFLAELAELVAKDADAFSSLDSEGFEVEHTALPATLTGIIAARLDTLDGGERALIEDAAVLGRTGPVDGLITMAREARGATSIESDLAGLVSKDLLEVGGARYRFMSNLVRDVAYGRLTKSGRAQQHYGIAQYLENNQPPGEVRNSVVVAIAEHYRAAATLSAEVLGVVGIDSEHVLERALYWLEQAGKRALDVGAPLDAARWYGFGVELAPDDASAAPFLFGRARARVETHDLAGARGDLERLGDIDGLDPVIVGRAMLVSGDAARKAGQYDVAAATLREAADRMAVLEVADQQALALRLLGITEMGRADMALARVALESSRSVAMEAGDRRSEGWALQSLAWLEFRRGRVPEAQSYVDQATAIFTQLDDAGGLVWTRGVEAWVAFHTGNWNVARSLIDAVLPETRRRGDPWAEAITLNLDALLHLWTGRAETAIDRARQARTVAERLDDDVGVAIESRAIEGRALVATGLVADGMTVLDEAFALAEQSGDRESRRITVVACAAASAQIGEAERAIRWAARYDGLSDDPSSVGASDLVVSLALALLQRGAVDEAAAQLEGDDTSRTERFGNYASAVGAIIAAARGRGPEAAELIAATDTGPATYLDRTYAFLAEAALATQARDPVGAERALAAARTVIEETDDQPTRLLIDLVEAVCGRGSVEEAGARLRALGVDPSGWLIAFRLAAQPVPLGADGTTPRPTVRGTAAG